jgi:hypothetical protein
MFACQYPLVYKNVSYETPVQVMSVQILIVGASVHLFCPPIVNKNVNNQVFTRGGGQGKLSPL